ncbi:uncharacterized protein K02A2.6-like [Octopus sinensis]|uniref:Uncharacterized protein K02A2.6-like n=1 Tax=Octopus sinensis TaxID=2607531 RepID=A0A6P7SNP2_9MOLL|nr:uncharacterized protein K02A2.6-like [Octopus sinensis]
MPWPRLHVDCAGPLKGSYYLVVVNSFSKWPEVHKCKKTVSLLHEFFARYGIPETIESDNGTQFTSDEFRKFCKMLVIEHVTTPPYHSRSNGQAFYDTFKRVIKKANNEDMNDLALQQFLSVYRVTPNANTPSGMSNAELLFARNRAILLWGFHCS